ncbi:cation:proton antiporter [candidate division KSB1 bacterium]|nr:cation:proton antiporter [candidate division KSB1 bacterium]
MNLNSGILLIFGIGVFGGIMSAVLVRRLSIPQVLGYIVAGIIIGETGFKLVTQADIVRLRSFNFFALGIIGFLVGSEIHFTTLKKFGKQFSAILLAEGILAFSLVGAGVTIMMWFVTHSIPIAIATGIVFGAISSATDPASTIDVLWEYRTAGILTTTIIAIVALDDALAMTLYGLGTSIAQVLSGGAVNIARIFMSISVEIFGSVLLGVVAGLILNFLLHRLYRQEQILATAISLLLLNIWLAVIWDMDIILLTMAMGITVVNMAPKRSKHLINLMKSFSTPLYVLFFVLVGARLGIKSMPGWLWAIVVIYVIGRSAGKMAGAYIGARISNAVPVVRKYTGLGLFAQGGVAIGLSIMASQHLHDIAVADGLFLGDVIIFGITATTFIVQIIGPTSVKLAVKWAGEIGKDMTEEDVIQSWHVKDVLENHIKPIKDSMLLRDVVIAFSASDYLYQPVVNQDDEVIGVLSFNELRNILSDPDVWNWLVASDVVTPISDYVYVDDPLEKAIKLMNQTDTQQIPVLTKADENKFAGNLELKNINKKINQHILLAKSTDHD